MSTTSPTPPERITSSFLSVLDVYIDNPETALTGYDVMKRTSIPSRTLYPLLNRMNKLGWICEVEEPSNIAPQEQGSPRTFYKITSGALSIGRSVVKK